MLFSLYWRFIMSEKLKKEIKKLQSQRNIEINRLKELHVLAKQCRDIPDNKLQLNSFKIRYKSRDKIYNDFNKYHADIMGCTSSLDDSDQELITEELVRSTFDIYHAIESTYFDFFFHMKMKLIHLLLKLLQRLLMLSHLMLGYLN